MSDTAKGKHGGERQGSGRKKSNLSDAELNQLVKEFRRCAKETGKPVGRILAEIAFGLETEARVLVRGRGDNRTEEIVELPMPTRLRLKAIELYYHGVITRKTETEHKGYVSQGPSIYLPEVRKPEQDEDETVVH